MYKRQGTATIVKSTGGAITQVEQGMGEVIKEFFMTFGPLLNSVAIATIVGYLVYEKIRRAPKMILPIRKQTAEEIELKETELNGQ